MKNNLVSPLLIFFCLLLISPLGASESYYSKEFTLKNLEGEVVNFSSFKDAKASVLFFWTSWCPFCLKELKRLNEEFAEYEKQGIIILPINVGESSQRVQRLKQNYALGFPLYLDEQATVADLYDVLGVPMYILIDKDAQIRYRSTRFPQEELKQLINDVTKN
ncbi:MAG: TlpA family protein disulfide reductase [Candidatus Omnitrophica bacterium]|nr:TlpA family protein disulfide reductase [Candidatus Omnitrophota bacterium]